MHGGSMNLAPADDKIIMVEHPISIDAEGQLLASVMAKKYSITANYILIDVPMGKTTKAKTPKEAKHLKEMFELIGRKLGMKVHVIITDGSQPIGNGVGPLLEAEDVMAVLRNDPLAPQDLKEKAVFMAGTLLHMTGKYGKWEAMTKAQELLESGKALQKMQQVIKLQGAVKKPKLGQYRIDMMSTTQGHVAAIDNEVISKIARIAGAPDDKGAGLYIRKKVSDLVRKKEVLYTIYAVSRPRLDLAMEFAKENKLGYLVI